MEAVFTRLMLLGLAVVLAVDSLSLQAGERHSDAVRQRAAGLLEDAARLFRQAQKENEGTFFARAHTCEGRARERLAQVQMDDFAAKTIREQTVVQFRQDAADAAPAFYDLGRALQASEQQEEAIQAYAEYLKWMETRDKVLLWERRSKFASFWGVIEPGRWPDRFVRTRVMPADDRVYVLAQRKGAWKPYT